MLQTPLTVLKSSLADKPEDLCFENEVRYKLLIDHSEDESLVRFLFKFGILNRSNCRIYALSKLPGDRLQKVSSVCNIHDNILYPAVRVLLFHIHYFTIILIIKGTTGEKGLISQLKAGSHNDTKPCVESVEL